MAGARSFVAAREAQSAAQAARAAAGIVDAAIAWLAERQHGVVTRVQLSAIGLSNAAIRHRVDTGRLHAVHRGVYAVGHGGISLRGRWMAATLATRGVLSHWSAAALWGLLDYARALIHVTHPYRRATPGSIRAHRGDLPADEATVVDAIPVTTVTRTIFDIAAAARRRRDVERLIEQSDYNRMHERLSLPALLERYPGRPGAPLIRSILADRSIGTTRTRSELEEYFLAFLAEHELPRPRCNTYLVLDDRTYEADCLWPDYRLIAELDSRAAHDTHDAFERDRERDRILQVHGWRTVRITWRHIERTPDELDRDLRALLGAPAR